MAPDYYPSFRCTAGNCRYSCCIGWEIDIDEESLHKYQNMDGKWGRKLAQHIECEDGNAHFRLDSKERCPFLNQAGLCELILHFGEDFLCQICTDHPRFRHFFSDRTEVGLGLCCEEACRIALSQTEPVRLIAINEEEGKERHDSDEQAFFEWRDELIQHAQNRRLPLQERIHILSQICRLDLSRLSWQTWQPFLLDLERMDDAWAEHLASIQASQHVHDSRWDVPFEQLLVYLLLRHLPTGFETDDLRGYLAFVLLMWQLLYRMFSGSSLDELMALARLYSSEIEYSDENIEKIIDELYRTVL